MTEYRRVQALIRRRPSAFAVAGTLAVLAAAGASAPGAAAGVGSSRAVADPAAPLPCPAAVARPSDAVGRHGTGFTVTTGTAPRPFEVEVLGVMPDAIAPGRDLIVVRAGDKPGGPPVISQGGGIWAGMSGSPVYVGNRLLGAVSFGFTVPSSPIGGLTPATDLYRLRSASAARSSALQPDAGTRRSVAIPDTLRREVAIRTGVGVPAAPMQRLRVPLTASGLSGSATSQLQRVVDRAGLSVLAHPAGRAARPTAAVGQARAGGNFAAVLSYGDLSLSAVGTTTAVCGRDVIAFGHPFTFLGSTALGASDATSLAIVRDNTFGSVKVANTGRTFGTLDSDRSAGVRARLGTSPRLTPIVTTIRTDPSRAARKGRTDATDARYLSTVSLFGLVSALQTSFDAVAANHSRTSWTITGVRAKGRSFTLRRANRWTESGNPDAFFAIPFGDPAFEVAVAEDTLLSNEFEAVRITKVTFDAQVAPGFDQDTLLRRLVAVNGGPLRDRSAITVRPGDRIRVRTVLHRYRGATRSVDHTVTVPGNVRRGPLMLLVMAGNQVLEDGTGENGGGAALTGCLLQPGGGCARQQAATGSFDTVLRDLRSQPQNNALSVSLYRLDDEGNPAAVVASTRRLLSRVVVGEVDPVEVTVR